MAELDAVSAEIPVMVVDSSGHAGAFNSAAFRAAGISAASPDPEGGKFERGADGRSLAGKAEETALNLVREKRPPFSGASADAVATGASRLWASYGQTTAQDCGIGLGSDDIDLVRNAIDKRLLSLDLYICAKDSNVEAMAGAANASGRLLQLRPDLDKRYVNRVRLGGIKFWLDGSIPTAWMSQPYAVNPPGTEPGFRGYQQIPDGVLEAAFARWWRSGVQINMHMNGDAAAEQALKAIEATVARQGMADHRPVFIHASYLRPDQIQRMKRVGAVPSFLTTSLIPGVNRRTPSGLVIGPAQRVTPYQALQAVTANAAWQIREEKTKGTLEVGKLADLVILERNPLTVNPATIKDIAVLETIKEGRTIFRRDPGTAAALPKGLGGSLPCLHEHSHGEVAALTPKARRTLAELLEASR